MPTKPEHRQKNLAYLKKKNIINFSVILEPNSMTFKTIQYFSTFVVIKNNKLVCHEEVCESNYIHITWKKGIIVLHFSFCMFVLNLNFEFKKTL